LPSPTGKTQKPNLGIEYSSPSAQKDKNIDENELI